MSMVYNIADDHHHYPIATHACFYFAKFGPDNASPLKILRPPFEKNVTSCHVYLASAANTAPAKIVTFDHRM
jgi:hypothetical protein